MNKSKLLKGLSIEELQERNEFSEIRVPGCCGKLVDPCEVK